MEKLTELERKLARKQKLIAKHQQELKDLLATCTHPEDKIVEKSYYFPGGYYDKSYVERWRQCTICGECSERTLDKNHYGSYG